MQELRANTAVDVLIGPFVDSTNGYEAEEGLTPSVLLSKNGQALAAKNDATDPTHDDAGYYNCELDATDTSTEGTLDLIVEGSATALPVRHSFMVLSEAAWDSKYVAKDDGYMDVNVKAVSESTTAADILQLFVEALKADTGQIDDGTFAAGAINAAAIADAAIDNATFAADVGSTAYATNVIALAVRKVLDELNLDHLMKTGDATLTNIVADNTALAHLMAIGADISDFNGSTDSAEALYDKMQTLSVFDSTTDGVLLRDGAHGGATSTLQIGGGVIIGSNTLAVAAIDIQNNAVIPTITVLQNSGTAGTVDFSGGNVIGDFTGDITGNLSGSVGSVTGAVGSVTNAVTVGTNNDKTGYSLTATTGLGNQTANITGTVSGNSTHDAAAVVTALGTGSGLTALGTAANQATLLSRIVGTLDAGTHKPQSGDAYTYLGTNLGLLGANATEAGGTGDHLTALATAASITTLDTLVDKLAPIIIGTVTGAGTGTEVFVYGGVTATVTVDEDGNRSVVAFT